eukprot:CAMPEP_0204233800 /NCGR_PEP_ID=MMETSP0361-20130328/90486_1 /ASSEMBLY_ACC=CAM_ASM_000343 /TAXON_ID=268821 /ORGANISM="Scrippsiella Hangoei, Strain SHTV-5" /LENGTH=51 /DNA_ID=CAMNT_0051204457 /DNA_START=98 /DNA_END=250 /DNA_ORIENTATION=+
MSTLARQGLAHSATKVLSNSGLVLTPRVPEQTIHHFWGIDGGVNNSAHGSR